LMTTPANATDWKKNKNNRRDLVNRRAVKPAKKHCLQNRIRRCHRILSARKKVVEKNNSIVELRIA
jgi:hypothetical protein